MKSVQFQVPESKCALDRGYALRHPVGWLTSMLGGHKKSEPYHLDIELDACRTMGKNGTRTGFRPC